MSEKISLDSSDIIKKNGATIQSLRHFSINERLTANRRSKPPSHGK